MTSVDENQARIGAIFMKRPENPIFWEFYITNRNKELSFYDVLNFCRGSNGKVDQIRWQAIIENSECFDINYFSSSKVVDCFKSLKFKEDVEQLFEI